VENGLGYCSLHLVRLQLRKDHFQDKINILQIIIALKIFWWKFWLSLKQITQTHYI